MPKTSAGLLLHRRREPEHEVFLVHPGGPFWAKKDAGAWSIPKGEFEPPEEALAAAVRETQEETGVTAIGPFVPLGSVRLTGGKIIHAFAAPADFDADLAASRSNLFRLEWPPRSGRFAEFPEIDRAAWFPLSVAESKLHPAQRAFLPRLADVLGRGN
jgi:predicted NUDIX family NTP pyrophosphohydrolase